MFSAALGTFPSVGVRLLWHQPLHPNQDWKKGREGQYSSLMRFQRKATPEASSKCPLMSHWPRWGHRATPSKKEVGELVFSFSNLRVTDLYPEKGAWEMGNGLATSSICHLSPPVLPGLPIALIRRHCLLAPLLHLLDCPACWPALLLAMLSPLEFWGPALFWILSTS